MFGVSERLYNPVRCPVRIIDKYVSLLPAIKHSTKKANFYLRSLEKYSPAQWYGEQVVGLNSIRKVMSSICEKAKIKGFIMNHSLRRTGTTRLFRNGIDRKLIKEFTGHTSYAVDAYSITSNEQHKEISTILTGAGWKNQKITEGDIEVGICVTVDDLFVLASAWQPV